MKTKNKEQVNIEDYDRMEVSPREVRLGDRICTVDERTNRLRNIGEPVKHHYSNPPGCRGKVHIDGGCYDNIVPVTIIRKKNKE